MKLEYNEPELEDLMKDFYLLTGIRIVLFDHDYHELLSYPKDHCKFCKKMKSQKETRRLCDESDRASFLTCQHKNELILYHCHAGLIEAAAPLIDHNTVIGYMMFGQISDQKDKDGLMDLLSRYTHFVPAASEELEEYTADIPLKTNEQIQAAAKIMEACTFYVLLKNTISVKRDNFIRNMDQYLLEHLSEDLSVNTICSALGISKTKLYQSCDIYYGCGIAEHIRYLRIERAKKLLSETEMPVTSIADEVGFCDYNYFCRVFKKEAGISAKKYRQTLFIF